MAERSRDLNSILSGSSAVDIAGLVNEGVIDKATAARMSADVAGVEILNDEPTSDDAFGFHVIAKTLCQIIFSPATQTPLSVGLDGEWGTGKTSLLRMVERLVRAEGIPCLWLNAWSLESTESMVASLGSAIQEELGKTSRVPELLTRWLRRASYTLPKIGGFLELGDTLDQREEKVRELASVVTARRSFEELVEGLLKATRTSHNRLVVFIDDLDRAMPEQVAAMLRHLKLILEARGCVFILAMDMKIVARSIETHYATAHRPAEGTFGGRFLEKLLQIAIQVPPLTLPRVESYLDRLGIADEVQEIIRWAPAQEICNPRRLKRYLNWLSITLKFIHFMRLPKTVSNATALRLLALKRDWPELFDGPSLASANAEALRPRLDGDREREFEQYVDGFKAAEIEAFHQYLQENPLLSSAVNFRFGPGGGGHPSQVDDPVEEKVYTEDAAYSEELNPASSIYDAMEAGKQAYRDAIRQPEPANEDFLSL